MKKIVITGYYGFGNTGDEAILDSTVSAIRKARPDLRISVLSHNPQETSARYQVESHERMSLIQIWNEIKSADLLLFGGGSLLQDATSLRSLFYYLGLIYLAHFMGKPVFVYANGIGPLRSKIGRILTRHALQKVREITVRDPESLSLLQTIGVSREVKVTADPAFLLEPPKGNEVQDILEENGLEKMDNIVWLSLRNNDSPAWFRDNVLSLLRYLRNNGYEPIFLIMQEVDRGLALSINESLTESGLIPVKILGQLTPQTALGLLAQGRFCIAMRLHTLILSARAGVPFLGIQVDPKIGAFCRTCKCPVLPDPKVSQEVDLVRAFQDLEKVGQQIRGNLSSNLPEFQDLARENIDIVLKIVDSL